MVKHGYLLKWSKKSMEHTVPSPCKKSQRLLISHLTFNPKDDHSQQQQHLKHLIQFFEHFLTNWFEINGSISFKCGQKWKSVGIFLNRICSCNSYVDIDDHLHNKDMFFYFSEPMSQTCVGLIRTGAAFRCWVFVTVKRNVMHGTILNSFQLPIF